MEKYTETAAIEEHEFSVETYDDDFGNTSFSSYEDAQIEFIMRNPKKFSMIPSVEFPELDGSISRVPVEIEQIDTETVIMKMPQKFLIPADEGRDLRAEVSLYEPMSGRTFDIYTVDMRCNTEPPLILNPTVLNNGGSTFVIAFEMPNDEEVAIRHKDLSEVEIDGVSYPVSVSTTEDTEGIKHAVYTFRDSHFTRNWSSAYSIINSKDFIHNSNAAYFNTGIPFVAQDREFTLVLRDKAGLTSTVVASTSVSKLRKPVLKDQNGSVISESGMTGIPFNEDTMKGKVTIIPPTQDHLGHTVSGATVHYRVYEATGSGLLYTSGTTTETKTIELPQNTYRVEAYATLLNYENSSTTTVKFRFINNVLFVKAGAVNGDGSEGAPYATIAEAIADINARPRHESMFTIYAEDNGTTKLNEDIDLHDDINTDQLTIAKKPGASSATIKSVYIATSLPSGFSLTINGITVDGAQYNGIQKDSDIPLTISNVTINNSGSNGIEINAGSVTATNLNISSSTINGINITGGSLSYTGGTISSNGQCGIANTNGTLNYYNGTISSNTQQGIRLIGGELNYYNGLIESNTLDGIAVGGGSLIYYDGISKNNGNGSHAGISSSSSGGNIEIRGGTFSGNGQGLFLTHGSATISGGTFTQNEHGIFLNTSGVTLNLSGGTISGNTIAGIHGDSIVNLSGNPVVQNNGPATARKDIELRGSNNINIAGALTTGCKVGVYLVDSSRQPTSIGQKFTFTTGYGNYHSVFTSGFFTSNQGFAIVPTGTGTSTQASIALAGANGNASYTSYDYSFSFAASASVVEPDTAKTITITSTIKRTEVSPTPETDLYYRHADHKLYTDSAFTTLDASCAGADGAVVNIAPALYNGRRKVCDLTLSQAADGSLLMTIPAIANEDMYSIQFNVVFLGRNHGVNFDYRVREPIVSAPQGNWTSNAVALCNNDSNKKSPIFVAYRDLTVAPVIACDHEVTQKEYELYCGYGGSQPTQTSEEKAFFPVYNVSWYDAVIYCNLRSKAEHLTPVYYLAGADGNEVENGREISTWMAASNNSISVSNGKYRFIGSAAVSTLDYKGNSDTDGGIRFDTNADGWRLPTEAEWEFLARGGTLGATQTTYSGSNQISDVAWHSGNSGDNGTATNPRVHEICTKAPNSLNLYDMSGNVWEWCWDWYAGSMQPTTPATGPASGDGRAYRGGSYESVSEASCRIINRGSVLVYYRATSIGFRVVRNAQ